MVLSDSPRHRNDVLSVTGEVQTVLPTTSCVSTCLLSHTHLLSVWSHVYLLSVHHSCARRNAHLCCHSSPASRNEHPQASSNLKSLQDHEMSWKMILSQDSSPLFEPFHNDIFTNSWPLSAWNVIRERSLSFCSQHTVTWQGGNSWQVPPWWLELLRVSEERAVRSGASCP